MQGLAAAVTGLRGFARLPVRGVSMPDAAPAGTSLRRSAPRGYGLHRLRADTALAGVERRSEPPVFELLFSCASRDENREDLR